MMIFLSNSYAQKGKIFWTLNTTDHIYIKFFYKSKPKYSTLIDINIETVKQQLVNVPKRQFATKNKGIVLQFPN